MFEMIESRCSKECSYLFDDAKRTAPAAASADILQPVREECTETWLYAIGAPDDFR
jgi:hypothetical protein